MSGSRFCAAYVGAETVGAAGRKVVVPDHKLYFVPVGTKAEAQYLTAILNARRSRAIGSYAAQLSLGVSVIEYLKITKFEKANPRHKGLPSWPVATRTVANYRKNKRTNSTN